MNKGLKILFQMTGSIGLCIVATGIFYYTAKHFAEAMDSQEGEHKENASYT
jgi:hypothetical protein